jgi:NTE family protein
VGTGTAFRFGNRRSYSWRFGKVEGDVPVSLAVAASAAYPVILPPLGRTFTLVDSNKSSGRFLKLVDGGVYDNLGTSALMPDRLSEHDLGFHAPSNIICCDAGYGQVSEQTISPFVIARILAVSGHIFRKLQDTTRARIFDLAKNRYLDSLVISQLGQQDSKLDRAYHKLPSRKEVISYPTNFSKMKDIDIDLLVARGEYLTRAHLESYLR